MPDSLRILIADDNEDLRATVSAFIDAESDLMCVAATGVLDEVAALAIATNAQVVILDIELNGKSSLAILPRLTSELPKVRFVMYSGHALPPLISGALKAGASRYVVKGADFDELLTAIRTCAAA